MGFWIWITSNVSLRFFCDVLIDKCVQVAFTITIKLTQFANWNRFPHRSECSMPTSFRMVDLKLSPSWGEFLEGLPPLSFVNSLCSIPASFRIEVLFDNSPSWWVIKLVLKLPLRIHQFSGDFNNITVFVPPLYFDLRMCPGRFCDTD